MGDENRRGGSSSGRGLVGDDDGSTMIERDTSRAGGGGGASENVALTLDCEALDGTWAVTSAELVEQLNAAYSLSLHITSEATGSTAAAELLGESCKLTIERGSALRHVTGVIAEVREVHGGDEAYQAFSLVVVPAFALLAHGTDTRIFQEKTVPEILEQVLTEGLGPYERGVELRLTRAYPTCEYRTQFDESDLEFCQRLMQEEGIYCWFETSDDDTETLVLADAATQFGEISSTRGSSLHFTRYGGREGGQEVVTSFTSASAIRPTVLRLRGYDWTHPSTMIEADSSSVSPNGELPERHGARVGPEREDYEHDLEPVTRHQYASSYGANDAQDQARLRRAQQLFDAEVFSGSATVVELRAGATFAFENAPVGESSQRYLVLAASHSYADNRATNHFTCIPADTPFRPRRLTRKPRVAGIQSARVVGPSGEEIHTDEHGRIKVQFHWDRQGRADDHSSCYLRVMQPWAGAGWGHVFIPRIGMEAVVSFINGDPDAPVVIGTLYNGDNPTPYPLPDQKTKSTIKTSSSLGGDGYNELTFEDKAGQEQIIVHAQKDYDETVEHDHTTIVHANQRNSVDGDQTETVGGNQKVTVRKEQEILVEKRRMLTVNEGEMRTIFKDSDHYVEDGSYTLDVSGDITIQAGGKITLKAGNTTVVTIDTNQLIVDAGGGSNLRLDEDVNLRSSQGSAGRLTDKVTLQSNSGATLELTADCSLTSSGGGTVAVQGPLVKLNCS